MSSAEIINSVKKSVKGVIGSAIIDDRGGIIAMDMPPIMKSEVEKIAFNVSFFVDTISSTRDVSRVNINATNGNVVIVSGEDASMMCITDREANVGLVQMIAKKALSMYSSEKAAPATAAREKAAAAPLPSPLAPESEEKQKRGFFRRLFGA